MPTNDPTGLVTGFNAQDAAIMTTPPAAVVGVTDAPAGNFQSVYDLIANAQGKLGVSLPTQPVSPVAAAAARAATQVNAELQNTVNTVQQGMVKDQKDKEDIYKQIEEIVSRSGEAGVTMAKGSAQLAAEAEARRAATLGAVNELVAENAREQVDALAEIEKTLDEKEQLDTATGFGGFMKRLFVGPVVEARFNRQAASYNAREEFQANAIAAREKLAAFQQAQMPTKTPEMLQAELVQAEEAAKKLKVEAVLKTIDSREDFFKTLVDTEQIRATAANTEAGRQVQLSVANFDAKVAAIKAAQDGAMKNVELQRLSDMLGGVRDVSVRLEKAFNLTAGEGAKWFDRVQKADPDAAAALMQVAYSGVTSNPAALATAYNYAVPGSTTSGQQIVGQYLVDAEKEFPAFLQKNYLQLAGDMAAFNKLPTAQQLAIRKEFYASSAGEIPSSLTDISIEAVAKAMDASVPDGLIQVPAVKDAKGNVTRPAKTVRLLPTGETGKKLAKLQGDATAAFELAKQEMLVGGRNTEEVAREYTNFFQNALTVEGAYRGAERKQYGLPLATKFKMPVIMPSKIGGGAPIKELLDHASYSQVLALLMRVKSTEMISQWPFNVPPTGAK